MNKLICPNCLFPFSEVFANCFDGNVLACPHCHRNITIIFKGRIIEGGKVIVSGARILIPSKLTRGE